VVKENYIAHEFLEYWIINPMKNIDNVSITWKMMVLEFLLVGNWLVWRVGRGSKVKVL